jgi:23S rRNA (adenine2503-C2)-methyltransferase
MSPEELFALGIRPQTFSRLQRPWLWREDGPLLSAATLSRLEPVGSRVPPLLTRKESCDGSTKLSVGFGDDRVETVHMPRAAASGRVTICVSSQVGCAMGCTFCATASMGFGRHLSAAEIVAQVLCVVRELGPRHPGALTLVFMGMGEPLHNLQEVARAVGIFCHPLGLGLSPRRITVSTSGLVPEIDALARLESRPLLAISLNATTDATRSALMPIGRRYSLSELRAALERYPLRRRERITIEYVLLEGINDSAEDAARLADFCASFAHQINLIPFNEHRHAPFRCPSEKAISQFARAVLAERRTILTVRRSRGPDIQGACGQLVLA